jgi:uncharacterized protein (DUF488 family)
MRTLYTIGHSTRTADQFTALLRAHGIQTLADVRTVPRSRHNPQFGRDALVTSLRRAGIEYVHVPALGGLRKPRADSVNLGLRRGGFRAYADHMQSEVFRQGVERLETMASAGVTAIMCAEALPERCHRALLSDALTVRGWRVLHILDDGAMEHAPSPLMRTVGDRPIYPLADG